MSRLFWKWDKSIFFFIINCLQIKRTYQVLYIFIITFIFFKNGLSPSFKKKRLIYVIVMLFRLGLTDKLLFYLLWEMQRSRSHLLFKDFLIKQKPFIGVIEAEN